MKHQTEELNDEQAKDISGGTSVRNHPATGTGQSSPWTENGFMGNDTQFTDGDMPVRPDTYGPSDDTKQPIA